MDHFSTTKGRFDTDLDFCRMLGPRQGFIMRGLKMACFNKSSREPTKMHYLTISVKTEAISLIQSSSSKAGMGLSTSFGGHFLHNFMNIFFCDNIKTSLHGKEEGHKQKIVNR